MYRKIITICIAIFATSLINNLHAQFAYNDVRLYIRAGSSLENNKSSIHIVFTVNGALMVRSMPISELTNTLKSQPDFLNSSKSLATYKWRSYPVGCKNFLPKDNELSTSARVVYKAYSPADSAWGYAASTNYYAFSKNGDSFIFWEKGEEEERKYYIEISRTDLIPKPVNYDFLNE